MINPDLSGGLLLPDGKTLLLWGSDATILRSEDGTSWSHADTPGEVDLARVASNDDGSVLIAVGARGVVLRSQDAGRSWTPAHNSDDADLRTASYHAPSGAWIAAGARGRILQSTNGGKRWTALPSPLTSDLQTSFVDPRTQRLLIGGDDGVIGMSADGGTSWDVTRIAMPDPVTPVTSYRRFGDLLLATSALGRFLISKDDGASWDLLQAESTAFWTDAAFDAAHGSLVLVGHNGEVVRSADGGETWHLTAIEIAGRRNYLAAVHFDDRSRSLLAVGEGGTVARSSDGGASWTQTSGDVREGLKGLLAAPGRLVSFGNGGLVVSSTDSGAHWSRARSALELPLREIVMAPGGALLASSSLGDLIRSADGGRSWRPLAIAYPNVNTPPDLRMLLTAPADDVLIAAGPAGSHPALQRRRQRVAGGALERDRGGTRLPVGARGSEAQSARGRRSARAPAGVARRRPAMDARCRSTRPRTTGPSGRARYTPPAARCWWPAREASRRAAPTAPPAGHASAPARTRISTAALPMGRSCS